MNVNAYLPSNDRLTAYERTADLWGTTVLPAPEEARHRRMMNAIRNIESPPEPVPDRVSEPTPWEPGARWRYIDHEYLNERRRAGCRLCRGTGEITVDDGAGGVDFDLCPKCQESNPYRRKGDISDAMAF